MWYHHWKTGLFPPCTYTFCVPIRHLHPSPLRHAVKANPLRTMFYITTVDLSCLDTPFQVSSSDRFSPGGAWRVGTRLYYSIPFLMELFYVKLLKSNGLGSWNGWLAPSPLVCACVLPYLCFLCMFTFPYHHVFQIQNTEKQMKWRYRINHNIKQKDCTFSVDFYF